MEQAVSTKGWRRLKLALSLVGAIAFVAAFYEYGLALNRGAVPRWVDELVNYAWGLIIIIGILVLAPRDERRVIGDLPRGRFSPRPSEKLLFQGKFMSGALYKSAEKFNPRPTLRQWLSEGGIYIRGLLKVDLTTERLVFGRVAGPHYRVVALTDIERWSEIEGKWPHRHEVYIEYRYAGRSEGILVWTRSRNGERFKGALRSLIPVAGTSMNGAARKRE
jgi:hypothetical protein